MGGASKDNHEGFMPRRSTYLRYAGVIQLLFFILGHQYNLIGVWYGEAQRIYTINTHVFKEIGSNVFRFYYLHSISIGSGHDWEDGLMQSVEQSTDMHFQ